MRRTQLTGLTGIRGLAAVWVVIFHAYPLFGPLFGWPERDRVPIIREGFLAVDLFFVLSGFVLSVAYNERFRLAFRSSLAAFAMARVYRIFPLHWATLAILFVLVGTFPHHWWGPGPFTMSALAISAVLVQNWSASTALAWNHPTWSLSAEWAAYLLFPSLTYGVNLLPCRSLAIGASVLSLSTLGALLVSSGSTSLDHVGPAGMVRCMCEFAAGALAWKALSFGAWTSRVMGEAFFALGAALLLVALAFPEMQIVASFAFVALIVGCALPSRSAHRLFGNTVSVFLGEISFSIYLVHIMVLGCFSGAVDRLHVSDGLLLTRLGVTTAFPFFVLAMAYLTWRLVEKPSQAFARTQRALAIIHASPNSPANREIR